MTKPMVSIIIPCFNAEKTAGEAIQSALDQTYANKEIIVIDDGSTDGSLNVIRSFGDRIRWENQPNRGAPAARNRALQLAQGQLIQLLDADDILYPTKVEEQVKRFPEAGCDVVFCDRIEKSPKDGKGILQSRPMKEGEDPVVYVLEGSLQTSSPIHKKECLLRIGGFREDLPCAQEFDLHLRLAASGCTFHHMATALHEIRKRAGSVSSDYEFVLDQYESIIRPVMDQLRAKGQFTEERQVAFARLMGNAGRLYMKMGLRSKGDHAFRAARQIHRDGWLTVYNKPARILRSIVGPFLLEKIVSIKRDLIHHEIS
jgi:GT2 family glycosyltransferase